MVSGFLLVSTKATVSDHLICADQSTPLYLQIVLTIKTPGDIVRKSLSRSGISTLDPDPKVR